MRILDLDLDFFLSDVAYHMGSDERLPSDEYAPWDDQRMRSFLEEQRGLDRGRPVPGRLVTQIHIRPGTEHS